MKQGYNFPDNYSGRGEKPRGKSVTVPNQALSIREIMHRSLRGALLSEVSHNRLEYGDDEDYDDEMPTEVDLSDMDDAAERVAHLQGQIERAKVAANAKRKQQTPPPPADDDLPDPEAE